MIRSTEHIRAEIVATATVNYLRRVTWHLAIAAKEAERVLKNDRPTLTVDATNALECLQEISADMQKFIKTGSTTLFSLEEESS
jgi:uncharacterized protein (UPF0147 family)